jgi:hypothetical protein
MSLYLSALEFIIKGVGEINTKASAGTQLSPEAQEEEKKTQIPKLEADSFTSHDENPEKSQAPEEKPKTWQERLADLAESFKKDSLVDFGKKIYSNFQGVLNDGIEEASPKIEELVVSGSDKFKQAQEEHDKRLDDIAQKTLEAEKYSSEQKNKDSKSQKNSDQVPETKLTRQEKIELKRYLERLYEERRQEQLQEQARQEALITERARLEREAEARRIAEQQKYENSLLVERQKSDQKEKHNTDKKEIATTPLIKSLIRRFNHILNEIELTEVTTEAQVVDSLIRSKRLSADETKGILLQTGIGNKTLSRSGLADTNAEIYSPGVLKHVVAKDKFETMLESRASKIGLNFTA